MTCKSKVAPLGAIGKAGAQTLTVIDAKYPSRVGSVTILVEPDAASNKSIPEAIARSPGPILDAYRGVANAAMVLGKPTSELQGGYAGALYITFERGQIILPPMAKTARVLHGPIQQAYALHENVGSVLGQPLTDIQKSPDGALSMEFERGQIILPPKAKTAYSVHGDIFKAYKNLPNHEKVLGHPLGNDYPQAGGRRQDFQRGHILLTDQGASIHK